MSIIATLYLPIDLLQKYASARLAKAVLIGEQQSYAEGLLHQSPNGGNGERLAISWMSEPPYDHEFFKWLLEINKPSDIKHFPPITSKHLPIFQKKIAAHLTNYLRDGTLDGTLRAFQWLLDRLKKIEEISSKRASFYPDRGDRRNPRSRG